MASPIFTNVQIIKRCHQILTEIEESVGEPLSDELSTYVTLTWGNILRGVNRGDVVPSPAQLVPGERRVRLAMALFLPSLQEEIDQISAVRVSGAENEIGGPSTMQAFLAGAMTEAQGGRKRQATSPGEPSRSKAPRTSSSGLPSASMSSARAMEKAQTKRQHFPAEPHRSKLPKISKPSTALPICPPSPGSTYEPSIIDHDATAELPPVIENWACNLHKIIPNCPILGFKSGDAILAYLAEVVVFDAFKEWKNDKPAEGRARPTSIILQEAEEELLRPTVKFNQDPIDKTNWDHKEHKLLYIIRLVRYGRSPGGIWENMTDADIPAMAHAALALLIWMRIHWRRAKQNNRDVAYKTIVFLYNENLDKGKAGTDLNENAELENTKVEEDTNSCEDKDEASEAEGSEDDDPIFLLSRPKIFPNLGKNVLDENTDQNSIVEKNNDRHERGDEVKKFSKNMAREKSSDEQVNGKSLDVDEKLLQFYKMNKS